jgi:hypothetical protein
MDELHFATQIDQVQAHELRDFAVVFDHQDTTGLVGLHRQGGA